MRALCHHYGVELQHVSPNAIIVAAVIAMVCEGYLGVLPHWDLWLHLYRGELFCTPGGATGVRKPVRAGCLNLVQKTGQAEVPQEYIPIGLTSNYAKWDSQWFYLRNDDDLFPAYAGRLISECQDSWNYGMVKNLQSRLHPLLDALKDLREVGLTAALVLSAVHHRRVLPLMSQSQRMDEMGPGVSSWDLEACWMSNEAPLDEEVAARVRAAVASGFQPEQVNSFPMKTEEGYHDLVSPLRHRLLAFVVDCVVLLLNLSGTLFHQWTINAQSSRPPVKEDDVDREKRCASAEKQKSVKDAEKKEKEKNLERQALEKRRAKSRCGGSLRRTPLMRTMRTMIKMTAKIPAGMAAHLDQILQDFPQTDVATSHAGASKGPQVEPRDGCHKEASPRRPRADTPPAPAGGNPFQCSARTTGSKPLRQGR